MNSLSPKVSCVICLAVLPCLVAGCASSDAVGKAHLLGILQAAPQDYRDIEVVPIRFHGYGTIDSSQDRERLNRLTERTGKQIAALMGEEFSHKGYHMTKPVSSLSLDEDWDRLDDRKREILAETELEFARLSDAIYENQKKDSHDPFRYRMGRRLEDLKTCLGTAHARAFAFVYSAAYFESDSGIKLDTGGRIALAVAMGLAGYVPPMKSPGFVRYTVALVDAQSGNLLWWESRLYRDTDPTNQGKLRSTVVTTLRTLPAAGEPAEPPPPESGGAEPAGKEGR